VALDQQNVSEAASRQIVGHAASDHAASDNHDLGFVGVSLNPDPYEGKGYTPLLGEEYWYPLWERIVELDVPILIHSAGCENGRESYSDHFLSEEAIATLSLARSRTFQDFPDLRIIIPHGAGSVPYQIGRWEAERRIPQLGGAVDAARDIRRLQTATQENCRQSQA